MESSLTESEAALAYWGLSRELGQGILAPESQLAVEDLLHDLQDRGLADGDAIRGLRERLHAPVPSTVEASAHHPDTATPIFSSTIALANPGTVAVAYPLLTGLPNDYAKPTISGLEDDGHVVAEMPLSPGTLPDLDSVLSSFSQILIVTPPSHYPGWNEQLSDEQPDDFYEALAQLLNATLKDGISEFSLYLASALASVIAASAPGDTRIVWWTYEGALRPPPSHRASIGRIVKQQLTRHLKSLRVVDFRRHRDPSCPMIVGGLDEAMLAGRGWRSQPSTAMSALVGPNPLRLAASQVGSWIKWFTEARSEFTRGAGGGVLVTPDDCNVPWSSTYMAPAPTILRRTLRHFGNWKTLDSLGYLHFPVIPEFLEEEDAGYVPSDDDAASISTPIVTEYNYRNWRLQAADRAQIWLFICLRPRSLSDESVARLM